MPTSDALRISRKLGSDLIEISSSTTNPPVCRIMSVGKFRYQLRKKQQQDKQKHKRIQSKEVKLTPNIRGADFDTKLRKMVAFLTKGKLVKITIRFKGRELRHKGIGLDLLERIGRALTKTGEVEFVRKEEERSVWALASPNTKSRWHPSQNR
ncbi:translation initiation factor [Candidatus Tremblaya phenacola PAVE]|nr:translation initiation factor [Candidatus Tremblaya phenacola PAVE]